MAPCQHHHPTAVKNEQGRRETWVSRQVYKVCLQLFHFFLYSIANRYREHNNNNDTTTGILHTNPRKRAITLVFEGGWFLASTTQSMPKNERSFLTAGTTTKPLPKTSKYARSRWRLVLFQCHYPTTAENEQVRSFSMAVGPLPAPPPYHHHLPSKTSVIARF